MQVWSQSPVLPRTRRAYETHLSAGSTAALADGQEWIPHSEIGPRGRNFTSNLSVLSGTSLLIGLHADGAHGRICTGTVRILSAPSLRWTTWTKW